jgi:hypothetical protein
MLKTRRKPSPDFMYNSLSNKLVLVTSFVLTPVLGPCRSYRIAAEGSCVSDMCVRTRLIALTELFCSRCVENLEDYLSTLLSN